MTEKYLTIEELSTRLKLMPKTIKKRMAGHRLYNPVCHSKDLKIQIYFLAVPELCPLESK